MVALVMVEVRELIHDRSKTKDAMDLSTADKVPCVYIGYSERQLLIPSVFYLHLDSTIVQFKNHPNSGKPTISVTSTMTTVGLSSFLIK